MLGHGEIHTIRLGLALGLCGLSFFLDLLETREIRLCFVCLASKMKLDDRMRYIVKSPSVRAYLPMTFLGLLLLLGLPKRTRSQ